MDELEKCYNIIMAEAAGTSVEGGIEDMTEAERREVYNDFRDIIWKAWHVTNYFKSYIEEDKAKCVDQIF